MVKKKTPPIEFIALNPTKVAYAAEHLCKGRRLYPIIIPVIK
jgi:hypothetical protein